MRLRHSLLSWDYQQPPNLPTTTRCSWRCCTWQCPDSRGSPYTSSPNGLTEYELHICRGTLSPTGQIEMTDFFVLCRNKKAELHEDVMTLRQSGYLGSTTHTPKPPPQALDPWLCVSLFGAVCLSRSPEKKPRYRLHGPAVSGKRFT